MDQRSSALTIAALGVVFGDIGTSPLYAFRVALSASGGTDASHVLGVLSLIFWGLFFVVTVKYVGLILRTDNDGEGGIMALAALLDLHHQRMGKPRNALVAVAIAGGALLFGDAVITPGISVLSAVEGLESLAPSLANWSVPSALAILAGLFFAQSFGAMRIAKLFGPVMLLWFVVLALAGMITILRNPSVLAALSPSHAIAIAVENSGIVPAIVGAIFLAMTGVKRSMPILVNSVDRQLPVRGFGLHFHRCF